MKGNSNQTNQTKDKKTFNNLSIASITTLNSAFDRKKTDRPVTFRNEEKKINISVCINPKTVREFNDSK
jgi:biotin synthase-related radical SAM superfamily protein